jgi:hypothetical protein
MTETPPPPVLGLAADVAPICAGGFYEQGSQSVLLLLLLQEVRAIRQTFALGQNVIELEKR